MPRHNSKRSQKNRARAKRGAFMSAPLQGMGETYTWKTNDLQVVQFPSAVGNGAYSCRLSADVNGCAWNISQQSGTVNSSETTGSFNQLLYAEHNSQFTRLASLWQEYRVDWVGYEWQPVGLGGAVNFTTAVAVNDESAALQGSVPYVDIPDQISSQKNVHLNTPYAKCTRRLNLRNWLGQTQERAWLQTQQPDTTQIIREVYDTPLTVPVASGTRPVGRTPALALIAGFNFTGSSFLGNSIPVGAIIFTCQFTFRQRRSLIADPFLDQTLLYQVGGERHVRKLEKEDVQRVIAFLDQPEELERKQSISEIELSSSVIDRIKASMAGQVHPKI